MHRCTYLIFVTGMTGSACVKKLSGVKFSRLNTKNCIFHTFLGYLLYFLCFYVVLGCKKLGLKNPACVKEKTNMRYGGAVYYKKSSGRSEQIFALSLASKPVGICFELVRTCIFTRRQKSLWKHVKA